MDAQELLNAAKSAVGVSSLYALAQKIKVEPYLLQRYFRKNKMPAIARALVLRTIADTTEAIK